MKRTFKKAMSILLAFTLLFGSFAFGFSDVNWADFAVKAKAEDTETNGTCGENLTWTFEESTGTLTISGTGDMYDFSSYTVPSPWYRFHSSIENLSIDNGVSSIGDYAFDSCTSLTSITIPDSVTIIGDYSFCNCTNLTSVTISDRVTSIGEWAFCQCYKLKNIEIPDSVTIIDAYAFIHCTNLTSVTISENITNIGYRAFYDCPSLTSITVDPDNTTYSSDEYGVLFNKDKTNLILYPIGNTRKSYEIHDGVTNIDDYAFSYCNSLTNITIPNSVTNIDNYAFCGCNSLTSVTIPDNVMNMGEHVFSGCKSLASVSIGSSLSSIKYQSFYGCDSLASIIISDSVRNIGASAFADCESLSDVYYTGSESKWKTVTIGVYNQSLYNATIHFDYVVEDKPSTIPSTTEPSTTKSVEIPTTTKPVVTEPTTTKPVEVPTTTKPAEVPTTTKPTTSSTTKPVETIKPTTEPITKPVSTTKPEPIEEEIIKKPSTSTVKYGDTLILHADFENIPADAKIEWSVEGDGVTIVPSADGKTCAVTSTATGDVTITAKYTDANGVEHISEQDIESNASFWQKIVSFFKNLFGLDRIIEQVIKF